MIKSDAVGAAADSDRATAVGGIKAIMATTGRYVRNK